MSITIKGTVQEGGKVGRKLGFPTANIPLDNIIKIDSGVYIVAISVDGYNYRGVANIGVHPTLGAIPRPILEVYILDYSGELYGKQMKVDLLQYLREEMEFASTDELVKAIENDVSNAVNYFKKR